MTASPHRWYSGHCNAAEEQDDPIIPERDLEQEIDSRIR